MTLVVCSISLLGAERAGAQSVLLEPNSGAAIHLEALRPSSSDVDISSTSFTFYLSGRFRVGRETFLRAELPFVNYQVENYNWYWNSSDSGSAVGNPYLGVDLGNPDKGLQWELGMRLPIVTELSEAAAAGSMSDYTERLEAFLPDLMPFQVGANYRLKTDGGFGMRLRLAPVFWLWVGDNSSTDPEIYALYSAQAWFEARNVGIGGGLTGRYRATGDGQGFDERSFHQLVFFTNFNFESFAPGFQVRYPLDDDFRSMGLETTYSLSLGWVF
jgi:hypothetical protein